MEKGTRVAKTNTTIAKTNKNKREPSYVGRFIFPRQTSTTLPDIISATMEHQQPDHDMREDQQDYSFSEQNVSQEMSEEGWRALAYVHTLTVAGIS